MFKGEPIRPRGGVERGTGGGLFQEFRLKEPRSFKNAGESAEELKRLSGYTELIRRDGATKRKCRYSS